MHFSYVVALAGLASVVSSHGVITKPIPRVVNNASTAACGTAVTKKITADVTDHVEGLPEAAAKDSGYSAAKCNLWLCRGLQLDATSNVESYYAGQVVPITVNIRIKHQGTANVSIVDTKANAIIGSQLLYWSDYANEKLPSLPANNSAFSVTIPQGLETKCATAGACVIQWWWYGVGAKQTYESCVDFVVKPIPSRFRYRN